MPVTKIKIHFLGVYVREDCDMWGDGEWKFRASIDGVAVGDPNLEFTARDKQWIVLPEASWSRVVDVSAKGPGDKVIVRFSGVDVDVFSDDDLGAVSAEIGWPFDEKTIPLESPKMSGGLFFADYQAYHLRIQVTVLERFASATITGPGAIAVSRQHDGSSTFTTVAGNAMTPTVRVCPIIPVPANGLTQLPAEPAVPAEVAAGGATPFAAAIPITTGMAFNDLVNPSVIPIMSPTDPNVATRAAKLAVTWCRPADLDVSMLTWHVKSGPAQIVGSNRGIWVLAVGTGAVDNVMSEFEVRWDGPTGPLLTTYRAWVGKIGKIPYRINILDGSTNASKASLVITPAQVNGHMDVAKVLYWQAALLFEADTTVTTFEGATASGTAGVYNVTVASNNHTRNVNMNLVPAATRYNFRPGVINIAYIRSMIQGRAVASDIQGVSGANKDLDGTPSNSWVKPSGVPQDAAAKKVIMKTFPPMNRKTSPGPGDKGFIATRHAADATFTSATMRQLYACMLPSDWWLPDSQQQSGSNLAHELGHVLGLRHRGNGDANFPPRGDDGVDSPDATKKHPMRGHPWTENVMTYGYGTAGVNPLNLDIDYIQAFVIRQHPAIIY